MNVKIRGTSLAVVILLTALGAKPPPVGKPGQVPNQLSKETLEGNWDVSDAEGPMIEDFMQRFNIDPKKMKK